MTRVLLLSRYGRMGASSRLRFLQYIPRLKAGGIEVVPAPFFDDLYLSRFYGGRGIRFDHLGRYYVQRLQHLTTVRRYDLIWLEKEALPWLPAWLEQPWFKQLPYVLDLDDAWFHRYDGHRLSVVRSLLGDKLETLARRATAVVVGNAHLEAWARAAGARRVVQLPTAVDLDRYPYNPPRLRHERFTIGWIGQPSTVEYLRGLVSTLQALCEHPGTCVRVVGAQGFELPGVRMELRPWAEDNEVDEVTGFDVGIAPLSNGAWERGKSGYKTIQYMAASRPVVASPVGANASIVQDGETGFLVESERAWVDALSRLRRDHALRHRMGEAGRTRVEARYSLEANVDKLADTLRWASGLSGRSDGERVRESQTTKHGAPPSVS